MEVVQAPRKYSNKFNFVEFPKGLQAALLGGAKASVVATDAHTASALSKENTSIFSTFAR